MLSWRLRKMMPRRRRSPDGVDEVAERAAETVEFPHKEGVPGSQLVEDTGQLGALVESAAGLVDKQSVAAGRPHRCDAASKLGHELVTLSRPPVTRWYDVIDNHVTAARCFGGKDTSMNGRIQASRPALTFEDLAAIDAAGLGTLGASNARAWVRQGHSVDAAISAARKAAKSAGQRAAEAPAVEVKTYRSAKDYERDAPKMAAAGWSPQGQSSSRGKVNMGRTVGKAVVLLPWALMRPSRKSDAITVTWMR
jgi:hypothetical protein